MFYQKKKKKLPKIITIKLKNKQLNNRKNNNNKILKYNKFHKKLLALKNKEFIDNEVRQIKLKTNNNRFSKQSLFLQINKEKITIILIII